MTIRARFLHVQHASGIFSVALSDIKTISFIAASDESRKDQCFVHLKDGTEKVFTGELADMMQINNKTIITTPVHHTDQPLNPWTGLSQ